MPATKTARDLSPGDFIVYEPNRGITPVLRKVVTVTPGTDLNDYARNRVLTEVAPVDTDQDQEAEFVSFLPGQEVRTVRPVDPDELIFSLLGAWDEAMGETDDSGAGVLVFRPLDGRYYL